ncbi:PREDICTED: catenin alpha-like [Priapulus caudatus]|uniref:Catenin alpha-like n=1 Tax=Priapulus caudatus TaxID=37621 RepID=A0ABM1DN61_PRICU|nr:PREDICTED: catenin alpha-like [Priapulus caudatus]
MASLGLHDSIQIKWDPKNLDIRTKSVEKTLEPLVTQVTTLISSKGPSNKKKGRSKKAHVLCAAVQKATEHFTIAGEHIASENPEVRVEMLAAVEEVKKAGDTMRVASKDFADDPCSSVKRGAMVRAARALLSAVTRLLILSDMVDVHRLLKSLKVVEDDMGNIKNASNQQELLDSYKNFSKNVNELTQQARKRQQDLKDSRRRDDLAAARAVLKKNSVMLLTTSKAYIRHPELAPAKENRDYVYREVCEAVNAISEIAQAPGESEASELEKAGVLASALDDFDAKINMDPVKYNVVVTRPSLEERLESIISGAALMADSSCTRDERRERIVAECNAVRQALQDLLTEYENNVGRKDQSEPLGRAIDNMCRKTRDLRRQLRKAVVDHVSDSFLETNVPLLVLIEAAKAGNEKEVEEYAQVFTEHANKLVEVATLSCSMSSDEERVKVVRLAAAQIESLCPQVINAARTLAARPHSKVALENMDAFKKAWEEQVCLLTEAVDDITTIDDFLAVSESHILDDVNKCMLRDYFVPYPVWHDYLVIYKVNLGTGPLKSTMDVIKAAKRISELGTKLCKIASTIAEQCPDSSTKKDLDAYLQRIALYCHQLNITSKVKTEVQMNSGELVVSGLDSATSLIQAAKNLMNSVVLTVKSSYVASTKYPRGTNRKPIVVWKMKAPEKKPLVRRERPEELHAKIRKGSEKRASVNPIKALSEFQNQI